MELTLSAPRLEWAELSREDEAPPDLTRFRVAAALLPRNGEPGGEQQLQLPGRIRVTTSHTGELLEGSGEPGDRTVVFKLLDGKKVVASRAMALQDCVPVLSEGTLSWSHDLVYNKKKLVLDVSVDASTDRRPRELIHQGILMKQRALTVARQLSLHKNKVVVGLLPPVLGTAIGIVATSPIWLTLTLFVGFIGFPVWFVVAVAATLVLIFSVISTLVTVQVIRSAKLKAAVSGFLRSPQGQLLLFQGSESNPTLSPGELVAKLQQDVMENPSHKLLASLVIDFLGSATFAFPVVGELADVLWAPVSAKLVSILYSESSPHAKYVAFVEELLPFTDFIPTATLAWMKENLGSEEMRKMLALVRPGN